MAYRRNTRRRAPVRRRRYSSAVAPRRRRSAVSRNYRPRVRRTAPSSMRMVRQTRTMEPGEKFLLSQIDPFSPECFGAKIPDSNTVPSVAIHDVENVNVVLALPGDSRCFAFNPTYTNQFVASTGGAGAWTWGPAFLGTTNRAKRGSYIAQFELGRPCAHALRIASPVAPLNATGFVHIAIAYESFYGITTWPWPTTTQGMSGYQYYKRVTLASLTQTPLTIVNKYVDDTAFRYLSTDSSDVGTGTELEFSVPNSWGTILIALEGVNSVAPLSIEHLLLTEAIPKSSSTVSGSSAASFSPEIVQATSNMSAHTDFTHTEQSQNEYMTNALNQVRAGAGAAGQELFDNVVLPVAYGLGQSAVHSAAAGFQSMLGISGVNSNPNRLMS